MEMGALDRLEVLPDRTDDPTASRARRQTARIVVLLAALVVVSWMVWNRDQPVERACGIAVPQTAPAAGTPDEAFAAWWAVQDPAQVLQWTSISSEGPSDPPARDAFIRIGSTTWEWRYGDQRAIAVEVGRIEGSAPAGTWAVTSASQCAYSPFDTRGGA